MATNTTTMLSDKSIDTEALWQAFLEGDENAYGKIFKCYYQDLYGYGVKFCHQSELVKDSIQEVFVEIGQRRTGLAEVQSVKAYLIVCLRRTLLHKLERQRTFEHHSDEQVQEDTFQLSPEELIIQEEVSEQQRRLLRQALQRLPTRQKEMLFLRYYNGMSYEEIEQILSINYQSIRNHVYRATKRLRNILNAEDAPPELQTTR